MHVVPSKLALASSLPLGCHDRLLTVLLCKSVSVCYTFHSVSNDGGYLDVKFSLLVVPPDDNLLV
jgi:hypothetical protein